MVLHRSRSPSVVAAGVQVCAKEPMKQLRGKKARRAHRDPFGGQKKLQHGQNAVVVVMARVPQWYGCKDGG